MTVETTPATRGGEAERIGCVAQQPRVSDRLNPNLPDPTQLPQVSVVARVETVKVTALHSLAPTFFRSPGLRPYPLPTMPREVSDIKQFIEICRRKDASCTFPVHDLPGFME